MGVFAEWQPAYAEAGLITLPLDEKKKGPPGWNKMGLPRSARLAADNDRCDIFGVLTGRGRRKGVQHPGVTVIDYDGTCEKSLADLIGIHGRPGALIRTASGKWHLYYRNSGERRKIRIHGRGKGDPLVDLCGFGGYVAAPPSRLGAGSYDFVEGCFDDIAHGNLPKLVGLRSDHYVNSVFNPLALQAEPDLSARNKTLFESALQFLAATPDLQAMSIHLDILNNDFPKSLPVSELDVVKANAWKKQVENRNGYAAPYTQLDNRTLDAITAHRNAKVFLSIFMHIKRHCGGRRIFFVANKMSRAIGCKDEVVSAARKFFEDIGAIVLVAEHTNTRPAVYRWSWVPEQTALEELLELDLSA